MSTVSALVMKAISIFVGVPLSQLPALNQSVLIAPVQLVDTPTVTNRSSCVGMVKTCVADVLITESTKANAPLTVAYVKGVKVSFVNGE